MLSERCIGSLIVWTLEIEIMDKRVLAVPQYLDNVDFRFLSFFTLWDFGVG